MAALKEALFAGRTAVWYKNQLIGRKEYLEPLFANSIEISAPYISTPDTNCYEITNKSAIDLHLVRTGDQGPREVTIPAQSTIQVRVKRNQAVDEVNLSYVVKNFLIAPNQGLPVEYTVKF